MNTFLTTVKSRLYKKPRFGLALGGGGARGLAHIGVLRVLEEAGIRPDYLAGTSMGGVMAALYATGRGADQIQEISQHVSSTRNLLSLADLTLPQQGILRGERLLTFFEQYVEGQTFADLQIPLTLVAVDLNSGQEVHLREGPIAQALRATVSLPGLLAPVELDGMRLVDGGVLNNVPSDVARQMGADVVLAVDVGRHKDSTWQPLTRLSALSSSFGGLLIVLGDSLDVIMRQQQAYKLQHSPPDIMVRPEIPASITLISGFNRVSELAQLGEAAMRPMIPALQEMLQPRLVWSGRKLP